jgi:hypothetical protein
MLRSPPWGLPLHVKQLEKLPRCPWEWWDCRPEKMNVRYLDFKPKKTQDGTWLLKTNKTLHGWCLPWHQQLYTCTIFHGIEGLQAMLRLGNMRRQFELFLERHTWRMCHAFTQLLQNWWECGVGRTHDTWVLKLEPENFADFVMLSNMDAAAPASNRGSHENVEWQTN